MTQAVTEFFLSEDIENFAIKNDDSSLVAKPLWVRVERQGAFHLALALSIGQTARGPLTQFWRDMSMSCELSSTIDEKNVEGFSFKAFFEPEDGAARIILHEAPVNCNNRESNVASTCQCCGTGADIWGFGAFLQAAAAISGRSSLLLTGSPVPLTALAC